MNNPAAMFDIEEEGKSLRDYINVLRRRKRKMAITAAIVFVLMIITAFAWPPTYRSQSTILIEQQDIPDDLVRTTITSYAQQRIEEIKQRIMTISNIMDVAEEFELYSEREFERRTRTEIAEEFRRAVSIKPISAEVVDPTLGHILLKVNSPVYFRLFAFIMILQMVSVLLVPAHSHHGLCISRPSCFIF